MAPPVVIENPILNSPFDAPARHFLFNEEGITDQVAEGRRDSGYFLPIASSRKKSGQLKFETEWTQDRFQSSPRINRIRERVGLWRRGGYVGCTRTTERLLHYWNNPDRDKKLFFCQREALETAIYITEVAGNYGDARIENELRGENENFNGGLPRLACKMATGSGKTVVMARSIPRRWRASNARPAGGDGGSMGTANERDLQDVRARLDRIQTVCAEAYQFAGAVGAPVRVLDNLRAAAEGTTIPHETMLPVAAEECDEVARLTKLLRGHHSAPAPGRRDLVAAALGRSGGRKRSPVKARASRVNGSKGGRPGKFAAGDAIVANDKAPGDYEGRTGTVLRRTKNRSEFNVRFTDGRRPRTGAMMSWWLDPRP